MEFIMLSVLGACMLFMLAAGAFTVFRFLFRLLVSYQARAKKAVYDGNAGNSVQQNPENDVAPEWEGVPMNNQESSPDSAQACAAASCSGSRTDTTPSSATPTSTKPFSPQSVWSDPTSTTHFLLIAVVALGLLIPLYMVDELTHERASLYRSAVSDIGRAWGGEQQIYGPLLLIPYTERVLTEKTIVEKGESRKVQDVVIAEGEMVVLPVSLNMQATLNPQERQRGIYRSLVYESGLDMNGEFVLPSPDALRRFSSALNSVSYDRARIVIGVSHPNALRSVGEFMLNDTPLRPEPGTGAFQGEFNGYHIPVTLESMGKLHFKQSITFNGSEGLRFTPTGETSTITVTSPWPSPSFQGVVLPTTRDVSEKGFSAVWTVPSLARDFPNLGAVNQYKRSFSSFSFGVDLYTPITLYTQVLRAVKYGILFIGLTFLTLVVFELSLGSRLHPVQYGLVGLSMVVFYLVLLSLSEHTSFITAYAAATCCIIGMNGLYVGAALHSVRQGCGVGVLLLALYMLLYAILQMEDYALLMGTMLVLLMLGVLMVASRNLNVRQSGLSNQQN